MFSWRDRLPRHGCQAQPIRILTRESPGQTRRRNHRQLVPSQEGLELRRGPRGSPEVMSG